MHFSPAAQSCAHGSHSMAQLAKQLVSGSWMNEAPSSSEESELESTALVDVSALPLVLVLVVVPVSPAVLGAVVTVTLVGEPSSSSLVRVVDVSEPGSIGTDGPQLAIASAAINDAVRTSSTQ
jgi:hypothetical protein